MAHSRGSIHPPDRRLPAGRRRALESDNHGCFSVSQISYGKPPPNFVQYGAARPLKPDTDYDVIVGVGEMHGALKFRWHAGQFVDYGGMNGAPASAACEK
jgi:hypothetical protein